MTEIRVTQLFRLEDIQVPADLLEWKITEDELQEHLLDLTRQYAEDFEADHAETGDCIMASSPDPSDGLELYLYPGLALPGLEEIDPLAGRKPGDQIRIRLGGGERDLIVQRILRRRPHALDDGLISLLGTPANALSAYIDWYREEAGQKKKEKVLSVLAQYLLGELADRSVFNLDGEALRALAEVRLKENLPPGEEAPDPDLQEEMAGQYLADIKREAVSRHLCREAGIRFTEDDFKEELDSIKEMPGMEEMLSFYGTMLINSAYAGQAEILLQPYVRKLMEEVR